ncbi:MAG TPA: glycosyltransferase family 4 protein [Acidimicrobiia bacterium]|nr:glycosyltransferase family 4 protein [Acidimicrobiia bacterium]
MSGERPLRVALFCPYSLSVFGGVQAQVLGLAAELRRRGVDARVVAPSDGPPPEPGITTVGPTMRFPSNGSIAPIASSKAIAARTLEALRVFEPDVLHLHEPLSPGANHAALVGTDIPAVGTFHAAHPGRNAWYEALSVPLRAMVARLAVRTAVSEEAQRNVEVSFGESCEILPNGVAVEAFASAPPWPASRPVIMFVGRHEPRKGLAVLLDAFSELDRDAVLWVVGEGPQTEALRRRGVPDVEWLGPVPDVEKARRLRAATVACFPSVEGESFGIVLLEAMAAGAAVVASNLTGYRTVARADAEAVLVAPDDAGALRDAIRRVLDDVEGRRALVEAGSRRAEQFSFGNLAERLLPIYRSIARDRPPAPALVDSKSTDPVSRNGA